MAGYVLTQGDPVQCAHGANATPGQTSTRVRFGGQSVVLAPGPWSVAGCSNPPPPSGTGPCVTATFVATPTRIKVEGAYVLCQAAQSQSQAPGTPLIVAGTQMRVRGT